MISKVTYYFGENKDDNGYEETKLDIKAGQKDQNSGVETGGQWTPSQDNVPKSQPGFDATFAIGVFMISFLYLRKK